MSFLRSPLSPTGDRRTALEAFACQEALLLMLGEGAMAAALNGTFDLIGPYGPLTYDGARLVALYAAAAHGATLDQLAATVLGGPA